MKANDIYICVDLKSFYASVECVERGLDPLKTNLLVADESRTDKTICLAVSPSLKALGVPSRPRLFEAKQAIRLAEARRGTHVDYIVAVPRMSKYIEYSAKVYSVYLKYFAPEDIHVYSVDEVFIYITPYYRKYGKSPRDLVSAVISSILKETGITATGGIGTNMYLAKIAMDILAKRRRPDSNGARIAALNEMTFRKYLWDHKPITDFWQIARGISGRLAMYGMNTMGDIAEMSLSNEELFYKLFGIDGELIVDHAWGLESCTMKDVKAYRSEAHSMSNGQVLPRAYEYDEALLAAMEQAEALSLRMIDEHVSGNALTLYVCYDSSAYSRGYDGPGRLDIFGRMIPSHSNGTLRFGTYTNFTDMMLDGCRALFKKVADPALPIRRMFLIVSGITDEDEAPFQQDFFHDVTVMESQRRLDRVILSIKKKYGGNAILRGMSYMEGGRSRERNLEIGGHRA
ncbi:MAG: DNA methylase [Eubacteriales bacterium]|nr:DNA methylase [Eubacteriales bacterium]